MVKIIIDMTISMEIFVIYLLDSSIIVLSFQQKRLCKISDCPGSPNLQVALTVKYRRLKHAATTLFFLTLVRKW